ncbi:MAG: DUF5709 domain-containing protein [Arachnia sp.]
MTETADFDTPVPDESEQLDQIQEADSLIDRGVEDVLDEGYTAPEQWSAAQGFGNTPEEMRQGETINQRVKQEEPEKKPAEVEWNASGEDREVGRERAGRLMHVQGPGGEAILGSDVGFSGGAASAEEAAMHIISEDDDEDLDS